MATLDSRQVIDAFAHEIAVALLDHVAEMDAHAELDAALGRQAGVALDQALLHFDRAAHGVDHAAELDKNAIAGALDDAPAMRVDGGIDQIAAQPPQPRKRAVLVRASEWLKPTTSATRIAAFFRVSLMALAPWPASRLAQNPVPRRHQGSVERAPTDHKRREINASRRAALARLCAILHRA